MGMFIINLKKRYKQGIFFKEKHKLLEKTSRKFHKA